MNCQLHCEFCGEAVELLPFKCKYCGGTYCKEHRLPENHECTFEKKHIPVVPTTHRKKPQYQELTETGYPKQSKELKKYLKKQEKRRKKAQSQFNTGFSTRGGTSVSTYLILAIFVTSIIAIAIPEFVCLSSYTFNNFYLWTLITSLFVDYSVDYFGLLFLFFIILLFYNIIKIIEFRFGGSFLIKLYLISAGLSAFLYFILWLPVQLLSSSIIYLPTGVAFGGLLGIISFLIYFSLDREMTFLVFFIPVRMRGRFILILLILFRLVPGLLFGLFYDPIYYAFYLPELGGLIGSFIIFKYKFSYTRQSYG